MKVYVINLDRNKDRLAAVATRLRQLGVEFERIPAVDGKLLTNEEKKSAVNRIRLWCSQGRRLREGEIGCAMSHYSIYRNLKCEAACILEDDVLLEDSFPETLARVERWISPARRQVVLMSNHSREIGKGIVRSSGDMYTEGYVITPSAAKALVKANWPMQVPCDHWHRWVRRGDIELYHAFPSVCTQDQSRYLSNTTGGGGNCCKLSPVALVFAQGEAPCREDIGCAFADL